MHYKFSRRGVQTALAILWLIDGCLQLQHQMFTASFAHNVIAPAAVGQPFLVNDPIHLAIRLVLLHPALFNSGFAVVQLALGIFILWQRTTKIALVASVVWAFNVWFLGEGFGGVLSGHTSLLMGAPGAALLYALLALAVLPKAPKAAHEDADTRPAFWLAIVWAILWLAGACYQLLPGQNTPSELSSMVVGNATTAPVWLASLDRHVGSAITAIGDQLPQTQMSMKIHMSAHQMAQMPVPSHQFSGLFFILTLAVIQGLIGVLVLLPGKGRNIAIYAGVVMSVIFWAIGQSFGNYYSGMATDPNTAPLFILMGAAVLASGPYDFKQLNMDVSKLFDRLERILT